MEESEYRFFITQIRSLEATNSALSNNLKEERVSFDVYVQNQEIVREQWKRAYDAQKSIECEYQTQISKMKEKKYLPGIIFGAGSATGSDGGIQVIGGLGWKIDIW